MTEEADNRRTLMDVYRRMAVKNDGAKVTVKALVAECGLSRQAFYYHFGNIDELSEQVLREVLDPAIEKCKGFDDPMEAIKVVLSTVEENADLVRALEKTPQGAMFRELAVQAVSEATEDILEANGEISPDARRNDFTFLLSFLSYGFIGYVLDQVNRRRAINVEQLAERLYRVYTGELRALVR